MMLLGGCAAGNREMDRAMELRSRILTEPCTFSAQITADYIDSRETFTVSCSHTPEEGLTFEVTQPREIAGICGTVAGTEGTLRYDGAILALPLLADGRISPVSSPWVLLKALGSGQILSCGESDGALCITARDSYADDALEAEVWVRDGKIESAELMWQGRRTLVMEIQGFAFGAHPQDAA